ncbi:MAG TPA: M23 family metallopeptidase [Novosphingobium sp.]|nr:M23 family metallopeptidase [Novosphingobium sp.]
MIPGVPSRRSGVSLTSPFGARAAPLAGASRLHAGLDLAAPYGSAVVARSPGLVVAAGWAGGYGNCVVIDHGGGVQTRYGHLSRIAVRVGEHVEPGALLGAVGSTGLSTGPHLHYEVRVNGAAINPLGR